MPVKYLGQMAVPKQSSSEGAECEQAIKFLSEKGSRKDYRHGVAKDVHLTIVKSATGGMLVAKSKGGKEHFSVPLPNIVGIGVVGTRFAFHIDTGTGPAVVHAFQIKRRNVDDPLLRALSDGTFLPREEDETASAAGDLYSPASRGRPSDARGVSAAVRLQQLEAQLNEAKAAASTAEIGRLSSVVRWFSAEREVADMKAEIANMRTEMAGLTAEVATDMAKFKSEAHEEARRYVLDELATIKAALAVIFERLPPSDATDGGNLWSIVAAQAGVSQDVLQPNLGPIAQAKV